MDQLIAQLDINVIALTLMIAMFGAWALGRWMGYRGRHKGLTKPSKFDDASMALLGLLLAFTFGMSIQRHDQRQLAVVADSNAISDFYTCATMLKEPTRTKLEAVIKQFLKLSLEVARGSLGDASLESALAKSDQMHSQMAELVQEALGLGTPIAASLVNTLNAVSGNQVSLLAAFRERLPASIVILLMISAIITALLIGREQERTDNKDIGGTLCFILLIGVAIYVTLDLNSSLSGLIQISQEPMERLFTSMPK